MKAAKEYREALRLAINGLQSSQKVCHTMDKVAHTLCELNEEMQKVVPVIKDCGVRCESSKRYVHMKVNVCICQIDYMHRV